MISDDERFRRVVLRELAYLHAITATHKEFVMKMASHNKMTSEQAKIVAADVDVKQKAVFADLCQRAGIACSPDS